MLFICLHPSSSLFISLFNIIVIVIIIYPVVCLSLSLSLLRHEACECACIQTINLCSFPLASPSPTCLSLSLNAKLLTVNCHNDNLTHPSIHQFSHPEQSAPAPPEPKTRKSIDKKQRKQGNSSQEEDGRPMRADACLRSLAEAATGTVKGKGKGKGER
ncbi:uncharacterized protein J3D65DRAFT_397563 [Phyllosticta citribraziliensis]|uniref:Uncharacterized protein n=1 Tax=Phyllosticta citribraziliensis TaxID=989973 RepID=A0ABR1LL78_9PEZI